MAGNYITEPRKTHTRSLVIFLRKIGRDPKSTPAQRLRACEMLREIELESREVEQSRKADKPNKLRILIDQSQEQGLRGQSEETAA